LNLWGAVDELAGTNLLRTFTEIGKGVQSSHKTSLGVLKGFSTTSPLQLPSASVESFFSHIPPCCIIVDIGHAATIVTPLVNSLPLSVPFSSPSKGPQPVSSTTLTSSSSTSSSCTKPLIRRGLVAGRQLTNILKHAVSYRSLDVSDEFLMMNDVKEKCCYVSQNAKEELQKEREERQKEKNNIMEKEEIINLEKEQEREMKKKEPFAIEYIMPNFIKTFKGRIRENKKYGSSDGVVEASGEVKVDEGKSSLILKEGEDVEVATNSSEAAEEQVLRLDSDRIAVPEALFRPQDYGS
jgi:actin-related protein